MNNISPDIVTLLRLFSNLNKGVSLPKIPPTSYVDIIELESGSVPEIALRLLLYLLGKSEKFEFSGLRCYVALLLTHRGFYTYVLGSGDFENYDRELFRERGLLDVLERESRLILDANGLDCEWSESDFNALLLHYVDYN